MNTLITIDNGNRHPHVGLFQDQKLQKVIPLKDFQEQKLWQLPPYHEALIIISQVGSPLPWLVGDEMKDRILDVHQYKKEKCFFHMPFDYTATLGDDRLFQAFFIFQQMEEHPQRILFIDSGTFITFDLITGEGLKGGLIFPGVQTFLNSYREGKNLPVLPIHELKLSSKTQLGHSTQEAIAQALQIYVEATTKEVLSLIGGVDQVIITGGASPLHENLLKKGPSPLNVKVDKYHIHKALAHIASHILLPFKKKGKGGET